ncbi:MAG: NifB/NifX family molybdenum-iron cluster-binding protein [Candidatus Auribacterota bacterium]|jgi:predicted Fe-Mo cluster-binding NifX family protein|nr:NifB/NifX family molybdenum-iron cluster-binding protein [Candidatus Auribacterota bacterium]
MKLALSIWENKLANVFDFAHDLLIIELNNDIETDRTNISLDNSGGLERVAILQRYGVDVLICGAISQSLAYMILGSGIKLIPFINGTEEQIVQAYKTGQLSVSNYLLPGSIKGFCKRMGRHRRGHGNRC